MSISRRSFLRSLLSIPALAGMEQVNRVYSFPTNIVIAKPITTYLFGQTAIYALNLGSYMDYIDFKNITIPSSMDPEVVRTCQSITRRLCNSSLVMSTMDTRISSHIAKDLIPL